MTLDPLQHLRPLRFQLGCIQILTLLFAILQPCALVIFEQTVLATVVSLAESAVTDDALCRLLAFLECAAELLGRHGEM